MFGDFDDEIDGLPDGLPGGVNDPGFTGFYRLEYGLWHGQSAAELTGPADKLTVDVRALRTACPACNSRRPSPERPRPAHPRNPGARDAVPAQRAGRLRQRHDTGHAAANIDATRAQLGILHPLLVTRYQRPARPLQLA